VPLKTMVNQALAPLGVRVIREPKPLRDGRAKDRGAGNDGAASGDGADALGTPFFPHIPHRGRWGIPADLASRTEPWARQLALLYSRPASWPASIAPETGMLVHALVRNLRPTTVVETGTCLGASTIWIAAALALSTKGTIHTFDMFDEPPDGRLRASPLFRDRLKKVRARFRRARLARHIRVHVGPSGPNITAMRDELRAAGGVQLAFIDADHTPRGVAIDVAAVEPVLPVGGYMLFHDVFPETSSHLGPRHVIDNLTEFAAGKYQVCDIYTAPANYGLALMRRVG
jgi:predicted O-methyltransferase YrrM